MIFPYLIVPKGIQLAWWSEQLVFGSLVMGPEKDRDWTLNWLKEDCS